MRYRALDPVFGQNRIHTTGFHKTNDSVNEKMLIPSGLCKVYEGILPSRDLIISLEGNDEQVILFFFLLTGLLKGTVSLFCIVRL